MRALAVAFVLGALLANVPPVSAGHTGCGAMAFYGVDEDGKLGDYQAGAWASDRCVAAGSSARPTGSACLERYVHATVGPVTYVSGNSCGSAVVVHTYDSGITTEWVGPVLP